MMASIFNTNMLDKFCFHFPEKMIIALVNLKVGVFVCLFILFLFLQLLGDYQERKTYTDYLFIIECK